jgi:SAM-dependent methyltransferase
MTKSHSTNCPACHSSLIARTYSVPDHEYQRSFRAQYALCGQCGSLFQTPMPDMAELSSFYPSDYHSFSGNNFLMKLKNKQRFRSLRKLLPSNKVTILDYGCGAGSFISSVSKYIPEAVFYGYEIADQKEKIILSDRVTIIKGSITDLIDELPPCDLITMNHVIEHLPDPLSVLSSLYKRLNENGIIEGQTPCSKSLEFKIFGTQWSGFHAPRHTVVFSQFGLETLLKKCGLTDIRIGFAFNPAGIAVSLASLFHKDAPGSINRKTLMWTFWVLLATVLYPIDFLSGQPGMINFAAQKITNYE